MANRDEEVTAAPRSFAVFLGQIADGDFEREAAKALYDLVGTLREEAAAAGGAAKGSLSFKVDIKADIKGQLTVGYNLTTKEPTPVRPDSTMWINADGNVVFEPPRQGRLFREVCGDTTAREIEGVRPVAREI